MGVLVDLVGEGEFDALEVYAVGSHLHFFLHLLVVLELAGEGGDGLGSVAVPAGQMHVVAVDVLEGDACEGLQAYVSDDHHQSGLLCGLIECYLIGRDHSYLHVAVY